MILMTRRWVLVEDHLRLLPRALLVCLDHLDGAFGVRQRLLPVLEELLAAGGALRTAHPTLAFYL